MHGHVVAIGVAYTVAAGVGVQLHGHRTAQAAVAQAGAALACTRSGRQAAVVRGREQVCCRPPGRLTELVARTLPALEHHSHAVRAAAHAEVTAPQPGASHCRRVVTHARVRDRAGLGRTWQRTRHPHRAAASRSLRRQLDLERTAAIDARPVERACRAADAQVRGSAAANGGDQSTGGSQARRHGCAAAGACSGRASAAHQRCASAQRDGPRAKRRSRIVVAAGRAAGLGMRSSGSLCATLLAPARSTS